MGPMIVKALNHVFATFSGAQRRLVLLHPEGRLPSDVREREHRKRRSKRRLIFGRQQRRR